MNKFRHFIVVALFGFLACLIAFMLVDRMLLSKEKYLASRYTDKRFVELMNHLIAEKAFIETDGKVEVVESVLSNRGLGFRTLERVRANIVFLSVKDGKVVYDEKAVSLSPVKASRDNATLRGSILDRKGVILAQSKIDERNGRQTRLYPFGPETYPIIGHWHPVYGARNLENVLDPFLEGRTNTPVIVELQKSLRGIRLGDNITLTIDSTIQRGAFDLMKNMRGAVVVLDVASGAVLAAVSTPAFDPNTKEREIWQKAFSEQNGRPYENRAFNVLYPPGSTFKPVVASAFIESSSATARREVFCNGNKNEYGISDMYPHGKADLEKAFVNSCNTFFSSVGVDLGRTLLNRSESFGFNKPINLVPQLDGYRLGAAMSRAFAYSYAGNQKAKYPYFSERDFRSNPRLIAQAAIGQNLIAATPLQMAMVAAAIANKGKVMNPYLVREIVSGKGEKLFSARPIDLGRTMQPQTARQISSLMEQVMIKGTGKKVSKIYQYGTQYSTIRQDSPGVSVSVCGKTGTAEVGDKNRNGVIDADERPHSWFIGFAPSDKPKIAVAVIAENEGLGALTAAPIGVEVLAKALSCIQDKQLNAYLLLDFLL